MKTKKQKDLFLLALVLAVFVWSGIKPHDYFTWFLETLPVMLGLPILLLTYRRFPLTTFMYVLLSIHAMILMLGGHYTYAEVPLGWWMGDWFGWTRNNYDKIGHLAQGFMPALLARELLLRTSPLRSGKWLAVIVIGICGSIAALYEILEWGVAVWSGTAADAFLGTQGYVWDTQSDMALAFLGAVLAVAIFSRYQDKIISGFNPKNN